MRAAAERLWGSPSLAGRHVVISGVGKVGSSLAAHLDAEGPGWAETLAVEASGTERSDDMISLRGAVNDLGPGEKELLYRRYFMEQTQQGIGDELGMSQMQVSRALARILVKLQKRLLGAPAAAPESAAAHLRPEPCHA